MGSKWVTTTLGDIALGRDGAVDGPFGSNLPASCYQDVGIPVVRGSNLSVGLGEFKDDGFVYVSDSTFDKLSRSECKVGDIVFTKKGTLGQTGLITSEHKFDRYLLSSNQMRLRVDPTKAIPEYVYFCVSSKKTILKLIKDSESTGVPKINLAYLKSIQIELPSIEIQKEIIGHLGALNSKITLNNQINQTLEQMAQTLFKSWFVDFDPVKAKMNGEHPKGMDAATVSLFPEKLVESELGLIPEGWEASSMGEHFNVTMGQSPKGETYNEDGEGIAFFQGRRDFGFRFPDVRVFTTDPKRYAKAGDTLISVRAPVGDKNMAAIDCCIGRGVGAIKHKSDSRSFTYAFVSHIEKKLGESGSSGTVFSSINQKELKKVSFVAPPQELVEAFHNLVDPIDQKVEVLSKEIDSLSQLRDTLLPKLLSGEIDLESLPVEQAKALAE
ncbi:restriction endonuclease subunit S [Vibrio crassostreae]|uniref:Type I restriction modification DNA specificity domain protein n=1 Tax=Vibrio crassostreae TaxID=246167 RepID=A0ABP1WPV3_9VIBR|nr:restriction endonuclease subunit S [Vibrio crassostreae]TCL30450.1 type I restriction enzyme S subunit [Vibrio crassostreae]TCT53463.1 type I restriction enzyme S subunit [Vibrio crassostreae]TCT57750.1 type I restriction enzyme S subunit [Vibrio crassostreae]CAK1860359.1 type I restriction enzyme, S subunit [Vibrio crassostreae]CAK1861432.1 type I restriction enzyme, S subunit [Vibrio crassostreae]